MAEIKRSKEAVELYKKAGDALRIDDYEKAAALYGEILKLLPNDDDCFPDPVWVTRAKTKGGIYFDLSVCYQGLDQPEKALDNINKAISITGEASSAICGYYGKRAYIYFALGEFEKARADVEKDLKNTEAKHIALKYYTFGEEAEKQTGNKREAAVYLKKAIEHGGDFAEKAKKLLAEWGM